MPLMICPKCSKFHYVPGTCPAPKSTAAQKGVHADGIPSQAGSAGTEVAPRPPRMDRQVHGEGRKVNVGAGTQAPPVDVLVEKAVAQAKRRGRPLSPNPKSPRAAYQRDLMRKKRAKDKTE